MDTKNSKPNNLRQKLKKDFNKKDFFIGASKFKCAGWYVVSTLFFKSHLIPFGNILILFLRAFGARIGNDVRVKPGIYIKYPWKLSVGHSSWLADCYIENLDEVRIGNNVCISQKAMLLTGNHNYKMEYFDLITRPVIIEDGSWVGANATICPGTTVRSHSVIFAGSVLSGDTKPYQIYQGNPAVAIRSRVFTRPLSWQH